MGELLRRYWYPIAVDSELAEEPVKKVRLLGEDLVLYRDRGDRLGLIAEACTHWGISMVYGIPEDEGLRCPYHGWRFDHTGRCLEQPLEDRLVSGSTFRDSCATTAYPVQELSGLIFAYMGPTPAPLLPRWELLVKEGMVHSVSRMVAPCNWLQCIGNQLNETHQEWLHGRFGNYVLDRVGRTDLQQTFDRALPGYEFEPFEWGVRRHRSDGGEEAAPILFPAITSGGRLMYRIPMDDTNTLILTYQLHKPPAGVDLRQETVPLYELPSSGLDERGHPTWSMLENSAQDRLMWYAQGAIPDRTQEHLGPADNGVVVYRALLEENMQKVARGEDPIGVIRDPAQNDRIKLPGEPADVGRVRAERRPGDRAFEGANDGFNPVLRELRLLAAARAGAGRE